MRDSLDISEACWTMLPKAKTVYGFARRCGTLSNIFIPRKVRAELQCCSWLTSQERRFDFGGRRGFVGRGRRFAGRLGFPFHVTRGFRLARAQFLATARVMILASCCR